MIPLALALGEGSEQRAPMARAVIGGLITSTLLTLFVVPVVYTLLDDAVSWARNKRRAPEPEPVPAAGDLVGAERAGHEIPGLSPLPYRHRPGSIDVRLRRCIP